VQEQQTDVKFKDSQDIVEELLHPMTKNHSRAPVGGGSKKPKAAAQPTWRQHAGKLVDIGGKAGLTKLKKALGLNTEDHRFYDISNAAVVPGVAAGWATAGLTGLPPVIVQGATNATRVGDSIRVTRMHWRIGILQGAAQAAATRVRIVGVARKLSEGAGMAASIQNNQVFNTNALLDSQFSPNMVSDGISVFFDRTVTLGTSTAEPAAHTLDVVKSDFHMVWTQADTTGVLANLCEGEADLWIAYDSNLSGVLASPPTYTICRATEFVDN